MSWEHGIALLVGLSLGWLLARRKPANDPSPTAAASPVVPAAEPAAPPATPGLSGRLLALAAKLQDFFNATNHPSDLLDSEAFIEGVTLIQESEGSDLDLIQYFSGDNAIIACFAMEALARREGKSPEIEAPILRTIDSVAPWSRWYALRALRARCESPNFGRLLGSAGENWYGRLAQQFLEEFRAEVGGDTDIEEFVKCLADKDDEDLESLSDALERFEGDVTPFVEALERHRAGQVDLKVLGEIGRVWNSEQLESLASIVAHPALDEVTGALSKAIGEDSRGSVLLVGERGIGKKTAIETFLGGLHKAGWIVFEASPSDLIAGQSYIGQLEGRLRGLLRQLGGGSRVIWYAPRFQDLHWAGKHESSPVSVIDIVLPAIESGKILVVGELDPRAYEHLVQRYPRLRTSMTSIRISDFSVEGSRELARGWAEQRIARESAAPDLLDEQTLERALDLAQQYITDRVLPGSLIELLESSLETMLAAGTGSNSIRKHDLLDTLVRQTGLPRVILDEDEGLDLAGLRDFFAQHIIGQAPAVEALVDRVAMFKAGLTDSTRPLGVFLFAGPTGSGKTEIAKTLAGYLFGSPDRMVRLDMSEFQTADSLDRILGESEEKSNMRSLVSEIRKEPFTVVLLDEFEKSHPNVWDLFLQVFDDGRLTDRRGELVDFRHAVIILTTNVGASSFTGAGLGFGRGEKEDRDRVHKAITETFRPEFINRLDRIVVFEPLERPEMRKLLRLELDKVLHRRGLKNRTWAVEWEDSAIEFLLEKGFTRDLGARPLKRAIDRYLLAPLARTIVEHQVPKGDQFLLIRSDGRRIEVEFVDPDEPVAGTESDSFARAGVGSFDLRSLALDGQGRGEEAEYLREAVFDLEAHLTDDQWRAQKKGYLERTGISGFWESPDRHDVLTSAELMDRIEAGQETARSLLGRLGAGDDGEPKERVSSGLVRRLAQQVYLIREALRGFEGSKPQDAFIRISARPAPGVDAYRSDQFARRLGSMYRSWGEHRRMRLRVLEETSPESVTGQGGYRLVLAVSGYGAYPILEPESGLHILESIARGNRGELGRAKIEVVPQGTLPVRETIEEMLRAASDQLSRYGEASPTIVRRYREGESPLVRDSRRRWRTTRADQVFAGHFDLIVEDGVSAG